MIAWSNVTRGVRPGDTTSTFLTARGIEVIDALMETPCVKICAVDPVTKSCTGCGRTLAEIAQWTSLGPAERRRIMAELPDRLARKATHPARGRET